MISTETTQIPLTPVGYVGKYGYNNGPAFKASLIDLCNAGLEALASLREGPFRDTFMKEAGNKLTELFTAFCKVVFDFDVDESSSFNFRTADGIFFQRRPLRYRVRGADARLDKANLVTIVECFMSQFRQRCFSLSRARLAGSYSIDLLASLTEIEQMVPAKAEKIIFVRSRPDRVDDQEDGDQEVNKQDEQEAEINEEDLTGENVGETDTAVSAIPMHEKKIMFEPFVEQVANAFAQAKKVQSIASTASRAAKALEQKEQGDDKKNDHGNQKKKYIPRSEKSDEQSFTKGPPRNDKKYQQKPSKTDSEGWTVVKK
jgi:hypothetical protein